MDPPLRQTIKNRLAYVNLTDKFFKQRFVIDRKAVLRKGYALRWNEIAPRFGVCHGCLHFLTALSGRCKENMEEYWSRAEARSRLVRHASAERGLNSARCILPLEW
jgi:hypothetical protein